MTFRLVLLLVFFSAVSIPQCTNVVDTASIDNHNRRLPYDYYYNYYYDDDEPDVGCINDDGKPVDWYFASKFPRIESNDDPVLSGERYVYIDSSMKPDSKGVWVLSTVQISNKNSLLGRTVLPVLSHPKVSYIIYNDQPSNGNRVSASYGHAKGIVAFGKQVGFWLIHSIPKFPQLHEEHNQIDPPFYPESGLDKGQSMLCITLNISQANNIGTQLRYVKPYVSDFRLSPTIQQAAPELQKVVQRKFMRKAPWNNTLTINSVAGNKFISFAKHPKADADVYSDLIAPSLRSNLFAETWTLGSGGPLPSVCDAPYQVENVELMRVQFTSRRTSRRPPDAAEYKSTDDHSKIAVGELSKSPWSCVGDTNRMESQKKRGGGMVCFKHRRVWNAYRKAVAEFEGCPI